MRRYIPLLICFMLAACGTTNYQPAQAQLDPTYRLGAGDTVKVTVFDEKDLTGSYLINNQGRLPLPLVGKVDISDQTEEEASATVAEALRKNGYLKNPKVTVETQTMRPFYIVGEVEKDGKFSYQSGLTVYQAVAIAGGYTYRADRDDISIRRKEKRLLAEEDTPILPGDVIEVGERFF